MTELKEKLRKGLLELRENKKRKFDQTLDLIVNLQKFDIRKNQINSFIVVPNKIKDKNIAGFFETKKEDIDVITPDDFKKFKDKKELKKIVKKYDFFIAQASLMPKVATSFGKVLGPAGKMPSPQLGILMDVNDKTIKIIKDKINKSIKIRVKQPSIKVAIGKESLSDENLIENISVFYNSLLKLLPKDKDNIKNLEIKFTMTKPIKIKK
jgi:large subunit ribosomal protein L1